jgi:hypothetical protein
MENIISFPGLSERQLPAAKPTLERTEFGPGRSRAAVQTDIDLHVKARKAYARAVAWELACRDGDAIEQQLEDARECTERTYREMKDAARCLLICTPTDPKGLIDLLLYLEQNFSVLPDEITAGSHKSESLAFHLLRTVRLSLRGIAGFGKGRSGN